MRSSSQHVFAQIPQAHIPRSSFKRDMTWKTAFDSGYLVPIYVDEALPGDTFNCKLTQFARLSNALSLPVMDNIYMDTFFFAVPIRLLWEHFERMLGDQPNPGDSTDFLTPILDWSTGTVSSVAEQSLSDYLGLPLGYHGDCVSLWHRAYNLIYNEWFRDENLQPRVYETRGDGPDPADKFTLQRRGKRHDYFTSCLPFVQKGPAASVQLGGYASVTGFDGTTFRPFSLSSLGSTEPTPDFVGSATNETGPSLNLILPLDSDWNTLPLNQRVAGSTPEHSSSYSAGINTLLGVPKGSLFADLNSTTSISVNALRESFAIQRLLEAQARGGSRFTEILRSCFGVVSPDARLQRPEFLGGGSYPLQIHSVAQTSGTESSSPTPQGNLAAYGLGGGKCGFVKSFVEHSVIIGLACVRCDLTYQQGLHRMFSRRSRYDFYWPQLHNLGEQAVLNREIYAQSSDADSQPFGYQERWAEYRYGQSRITGRLRSDASTSLDAWHLAQDFASLPTLNSTFISEDPPLNRVLAVEDEPQIVYDSLISLNCVRPMGCYSIPGLIDHF